MMGTLRTSKAIPGKGANPFRMSASAGTTGYLANTAAGTTTM